MHLNTLSGRFLIVTTVFVILAEVLILLPGLANFRVDWFETRLERAQIASLALLATDSMIEPELEAELLANAGVFNVVLRRDAVRQLILSSTIPQPVSVTYDLREGSELDRIREALAQMVDTQNHVIRVIGNPVQQGGEVIEVTLETLPLRDAMFEYGLRLLSLSAAFSTFTALLLFFAVRRVMVLPIKRVVAHMAAYADSPEDARRIIEPTARIRELRVAEDALASMQTQLTAALKQKERLAQLGQAVAKISHDLRNILTTAQLFADRMETSQDPAVARAAPKLVNSISRAVNLCETTLAFGRAEEPAPTLTAFALEGLLAEVVEGEELSADQTQKDGAALVDFVTDISGSIDVRADREQLYRVLSNLVRNARQAIEGTRNHGTIEIGAGRHAQGVWIRVQDTGPGLPQRAREHLFQPFSGGSRKGGTGLGLAISAELIRGHGGQLELVRTDSEGTEFMIRLPDHVEIGEITG
ncbi:sensor histidine kinase [Albirhodobacter sp. R86504]|jgi:signal transduction histidine kinase|uniref:sensor histidine kinase n=1 Tax=Albirhodobacter sp. R86504 TaxID=3093848 RepID=UPI0036700006